MSKMYANPFFWGEPVNENHYIPRPEEEQQILEAIENQQQLLITGNRGTGKTSLIKHVIQKSPAASIYLDLSFVVSRSDLCKYLLKQMKEDFPEVNHQDGLISLSNSEQELSLSSIFNFLYAYLKKRERKFAIIWDEFHHLIKLKDNVMSELKRELSKGQGITHIFISNRKDLLDTICSNKEERFFQKCEVVQVERIERQAYKSFLTTRFRRMGLNDYDIADSILDFTECKAQLTQKLAHSLAQLWLEGTTTRLLERTISKMLREHNALFISQWDSFGVNEKRLMLGLASGFSRPTELSFISKFGLSATSTAHNTVIKLLKEGWLINHDEGYYIYDPIFLKWLKIKNGIA